MMSAHILTTDVFPPCMHAYMYLMHAGRRLFMYVALAFQVAAVVASGCAVMFYLVKMIESTLAMKELAIVPYVRLHAG